MHTIWYQKPARQWRDALPLSNGFTGLMVFGSLKKERLCFNDGTLWSGYPKDYNSANSLSYLAKVRSLIFAGKNSEADALCEEKLSGFYSETFLPLGELTLRFRHIKTDGYSRSLDLSSGVHTVQTSGCTAQAFSSYPDKISVYRVVSDRPFSVKIKAKSKLHHKATADRGLSLFGNAPDYAAPKYHRTSLFPIRYQEKKGMAFCLRAEADTDGSVRYGRSSMTVKNATTLTLYCVTETGFRGFDQMPDTCTANVLARCKKRLSGCPKAFEQLKQRHTDDFSSLFHQQHISLGSETTIPTDELLKQVKDGGDETALCELFYNFGKYMVISGSRPGGQPLNLQGIWNNAVRPPWSSNFTVNINTEMNYWGASRSGLSPCIEPLVQMVHETLQNGKKTAQINYGCRGFACNHNVDLWRKTPPVQGDANYMFAPLCGVWLANEVCMHYQNGFLENQKEKITEIVTEAARFCCDFLTEHDGHYVICPSTSPENVFTRDGKRCKLDYASAFDMGLVRQCFQNALQLSGDEALKTEIAEKTKKLYPFYAGKNGIGEWHTDFETPEKGHRHFSPLYAFYPSNVIGYYRNPGQRQWVADLFRYRLQNSGQHIGWSAAWAICLSARLRDKDCGRKVIRDLLCHAVFKNLFCVHPPDYFQIDGNLGFIAGLNEMLLTEEDNVLELLPGLPDNMRRKGSVHDMVVNGAKVSFQWENGQITELHSDRPVLVRRQNLSPDIKTDTTILWKENIS